MGVNTQQLVYVVADAVAMHNLIHYAKKDDNRERLRLIAGATMAGLGFSFGPELEQRLKHLDDAELSETMKQRFMYTAGGAVLGGVLGYAFGPEAYKMKTTRDERIKRHRKQEPRIRKVLDETDVDRPGFDPQRPGGLLTIASAGWLGYSLLLHDQTDEAQDRQLWGLGAGVLGYMYGPRALQKLKNLTIPRNVQQDAAAIYTRGSAMFGALAGGAIGWYAGRKAESEP